MTGRSGRESPSGSPKRRGGHDVTDEERFDAEEAREEGAEEGDVEGHRIKHDDADPPEADQDYMKK